MKNKLIFCCLAFILAACSKNKNLTDDQNDLPLVITEISPDAAFEGDEITIKGKGFGTDPSKIKVYFYGENECPIVSLKDTVVVVTLPVGIWYGLNNYGHFKIVRGIKDFTFDQVLTVKKELQLVNVNNRNDNTSRIRPDNVMEFETIEADKIFIAFEGNDIEVTGATITENHYKTFTVNLPPDFYGTDRFEDTATAWVKVIAAAGSRRVSKDYKTRLMPETFINRIAISSDTWSLKQLLAGGKVLGLKLEGRNLFSRCYFKIMNTTSNTLIFSDVLGASDSGIFYSELEKGIPVTSFTQGSYRLSLYTPEGKWMGDANSFTLIK
ncbi:MAG: IPT/TIG domain-containing protein [Agriterribacter sp.]